MVARGLDASLQTNLKPETEVHLLHETGTLRVLAFRHGRMRHPSSVYHAAHMHVMPTFTTQAGLRRDMRNNQRRNKVSYPETLGGWLHKRLDRLGCSSEFLRTGDRGPLSLLCCETHQVVRLLESRKICLAVATRSEPQEAEGFRRPS